MLGMEECVEIPLWRVVAEGSLFRYRSFCSACAGTFEVLEFLKSFFFFFFSLLHYIRESLKFFQRFIKFTRNFFFLLFFFSKFRF